MMNRRRFLTLSAQAGVLAMFHLAGVSCSKSRTAAARSLPALPYAPDALAPHIGAQTVALHYEKHHAGYLNKLNQMLQGTSYATLSVEEIVRKTAGDPQTAAIFNNAAQVFNHTFYWESMSPKGGGAPTGRLLQEIQKAFGSPEGFAEKFAAAANGQFGSGWAWLVKDGDGLAITATSNADTPMAHGQIPLLTLDVWEHAYYLDYQNRRADYVTAWLTHLVDWEFAARNLG